MTEFVVGRKFKCGCPVAAAIKEYAEPEDVLEMISSGLEVKVEKHDSGFQVKRCYHHLPTVYLVWSWWGEYDDAQETIEAVYTNKEEADKHAKDWKANPPEYTYNDPDVAVVPFYLYKQYKKGQPHGPDATER